MNYITLFINSILLLQAFTTITAQSYDDVVVLINSNDTESILVGEYFQSKHDIPSENLFYINMPSTETIDSLEMEEIISQIKSKLENHPSHENINYFITTTGCPQSVRTNLFGNDIFFRNFEIHISTLSYNNTQNSYRDQDIPFESKTYGYRITSRLDSKSLEGTFRLIDRGGVQRIDLNKEIVLDIYSPFSNNLSDHEYEFVKSKLLSSEETINSFNLKTELDTVLSHYSMNRSLTAYYLIANSCANLPLSEFVAKTEHFAILEQCGSALKSNSGQNLTVYDFLENKCYSSIGYPSTFYLSTIDQSKFYENYFDVAKNLNIGEAFFSSISFSSPPTLFGDPKSKLELLSSLYRTESNLSFEIFPNPTNDILNINLENSQLQSIAVYNAQGNKVYESTNSSNEYQINLSSYSPGIYHVVATDSQEIYSKKFIKL